MSIITKVPRTRPTPTSGTLSAPFGHLSGHTRCPAIVATSRDKIVEPVDPQPSSLTYCCRRTGRPASWEGCHIDQSGLVPLSSDGVADRIYRRVPMNHATIKPTRRARSPPLTLARHARID